MMKVLRNLNINTMVAGALVCCALLVSVLAVLRFTTNEMVDDSISTLNQINVQQLNEVSRAAVLLNRARIQMDLAKKIALRVAAAEAVGEVARRVQLLGRGGVVALPEGGEALDQRQAGLAGPACRLAAALGGVAVGLADPLHLLQAVGAQVGHDGVPVVEGVELAVGVLVPGPGDLLPARAEVLAQEVEAPEQGRGVDQVEGDGAPVLADRAVVGTGRANPGILDTLAEALFQSGNRLGALLTIDEAIRLVPHERYFLEQRRRFTGERAAEDRPPPPDSDVWREDPGEGGAEPPPIDPQAPTLTI